MAAVEIIITQDRLKLIILFTRLQFVDENVEGWRMRVGLYFMRMIFVNLIVLYTSIDRLEF